MNTISGNFLDNEKEAIILNKFKLWTSSPQPNYRRNVVGMTSAICNAEPKTEEIEKTKQLENVLQKYNIFETETELRHRVEVLLILEILAKKWIRDISVLKHVPPSIAEKLGGRIYIAGSFRLGVHQKGADIDVVLVVPKSINRNDLFNSFFEILRNHPEVTQCRAIRAAFVPVIKMNFDGIEIDLLFTRLTLPLISDSLNILDDQLLKNIDPQSIRSLNGCRVTEEILGLVPNIDSFRLVLRSIKLWAKNQGIYSNSLGYFGGVSWAILVARTCQLYPNASASVLVHKFFLIFTTWKWPSPILLKPFEYIDMVVSQKVWDPRTNAGDRLHLMPIITPSYPQQNSTFNVTQSTKKVIIEKLNQGLAISIDIMNGKATWDRLFDAPSFFFKYRHFLLLNVNSETADDHLEWCGLIESKIRYLVAKLEQNQHINFVHVNPKSFDLFLKKQTDSTTNGVTTDAFTSNDNNNVTSPAFCSIWFIGLQFLQTKHLNIDLTASISSFVETVHTQAEKIGMLKESMQIEIKYITRKQLSQYLDSDTIKNDRRNYENNLPKSNTTLGKRTSTHLNTEQRNSAKKRRCNESSIIKDGD